MEPPYRETTEPSSESQSKLKCPFYQRNPRAHPEASCKNTCYGDMYRLIQHIKRVHVRGPGCECSPRCPKKEPCLRMAAKINSIKLNDPHFQNKSRERKWELVFEMLFPGVPVPSPYEQEGLTHDEEGIFLHLFVKNLQRRFGSGIDPAVVEKLYYTCKQKARSSIEQGDQTGDDSMDEADCPRDALSMRDGSRVARARVDPNCSTKIRRSAQTAYEEEGRMSRSRDNGYSAPSSSGNPAGPRKAQTSHMQMPQTVPPPTWSAEFSTYGHRDPQGQYHQQGYTQQLGLAFQQNARPNPSSTNPPPTTYGYALQPGNTDAYGNTYQSFNWNQSNGM